MLILHGSDLQIGSPYLPDRAKAFLALATDVRPDLVVVSGDLTQRAKKREYGIARELLSGLSEFPTVVTPGNHDVPLYRFWERVLAPYRNWRAHISPDLDSVTRVPGATVVALNSAAPRRAIVAGRLRERQVGFARAAFEAAASNELRLLVVHHHFAPTKDGRGGRPLRNAVRLLTAFEAMGVDLLLGGHVHQTHVWTSRDLVPGDGPGIPMVACGTTASSRGRGDEVEANTLNVIEVNGDEIEVAIHRFEEDLGCFSPVRSVHLPRANGRSRPVALPGGSV